jgi:cell division transport system permease protein
MNRFARFPIDFVLTVWSAIRRSAPVPDLRVVNTDSVANRALITVIAIMTFLAALAGGGASMMRSASKEWSASLSNEITIQIKPAIGRDAASDLSIAEKIVTRFPGVEKAYVLSQADSNRG